MPPKPKYSGLKQEYCRVVPPCPILVLSTGYQKENGMAKKFPIFPKHPERICWGCDKYCSAEDLQCGNGCERIQHPCELDGAEWYKKGDWSNLLSEQQQRELGLLSEKKTSAKPHIKLPLKAAK